MPIDKGDTLLNKYRITRMIGEGGNGRVWQAEEISFGNRAVAIKEPRSDLPASDLEEVRRRYQQEVDIYAALQKVGAPNIVPVFTVEPFDGSRLLVMAYMPGGDLETLLRGHPNGLPVDQAVDIAHRMLRALQVAHEHPMEIVHRDIKPSNILFDVSGKAYLADFGLAQLSGMSGRSQLQGARSHPGTPLYMAPEQETSVLSLTPSADVYALGCVLFEMLTGKRYKRVRPGTSASSLRPDMPAAIDVVLAGSLAEDPFDRYSDAGQMAGALDAAIAVMPTKPSSAKPQPTPTTAGEEPAAAAALAAKPEPKNTLSSASTQSTSVPPPASPRNKKSNSISWLWWLLGILATASLVWFLFFRFQAPETSVPPTATEAAPTPLPYAPTATPAPPPTGAAAGGETGAVLGGYEGMVADHDTGTGIPGVQIVFESEDGSIREVATSGENGQYSIKLPVGRYQVTASHETYNSYSTGSGFFVVPDSQMHHGDIEMWPLSQ